MTKTNSNTEFPSYETNSGVTISADDVVIQLMHAMPKNVGMNVNKEISRKTQIWCSKTLRITLNELQEGSSSHLDKNR